MDDVNHNNMNGVRYKTGIYYYNDDDDDDGHGKCSCWSQNNFFVVLVCISVFLNGYLYHVHNMLPSKNNIMTRSSNPTKTATNSNTLYTEFTKGLSSMNVSTATIPPTKLSALTVTATLATTMDTTMDTSMNATDDDCNVTSISSRITYHFEATAKYRQSKTLPKWMIDYFDWHREQTIALNECNFRDYRFMILRCSLVEKNCGGVADRLKSLPFFIAAAASSKRIFLIRWERPTKLEEFLLPNEINWSVPDWMYGKVNSFKDSPDAYYIPRTKRIVMGIKKYKDVIILEGSIQDYYGGSRYYYQLDCEMDENKTFDEEYHKKDMAGWNLYEVISRDLFYTLFKPSQPIAKLVQDKLQSANLVPNEFATSHYRAFYAIEHRKDSKKESELITRTTNALNCASKLQPGAPIFFASDSHIAVLSARKMAEDNNNRQIVTFDDEQEALHLDKTDQWKSGNITDFFPTFVDLLIMAESKCMSLGAGGFGRFANILSRDPTCLIQHESDKRMEYCKWYDDGDGRAAIL